MNRDEWVIRIHIYETGLRKWRETLKEDTDSMIDSWPWGFGIRYGKKSSFVYLSYISEWACGCVRT